MRGIMRVDLQKRFDELGPWYTKFSIDGASYGGDHSYVGDHRIQDFFDWANPSGKILEMGSFEGGHSFMLSQHKGVESVVGLEGRDYLIERSEFVRDALDIHNVDFVLHNFEKDDLTKYGQFDAVFCSGLFYHLKEPWKIIEQLSLITRKLFIATHYAQREDVEVGGFKGIFSQEGGYDDPLSGLTNVSFWPSFKHLIFMLICNGFTIVRARDFETYADNDYLGMIPLVNIYCEQRR